MTTENKHNFIDFCKGMAIIMVILVHSAQPFNLIYPWNNVFGILQLGVQIFFVLSGYTQCHSLNTKKLTFIQFMKNRINRIAPNWWGIICCYLILGNLSILFFGRNLTGSDLRPRDVFINILMLNGIVTGDANNLVVRCGWFIGTIIILYLLTPSVNWLYYKMDSHFRKILPLLSLLINIIIFLVLRHFCKSWLIENNNFVYFSFMNQMPCYLTGFVMYDLISSGIKRNRVIEATAIVSLIVTILSYSFSSEFSFMLVPFLFSIGFASFFITLYNHFSSMGSWIKPLIISYGKHSFAIYLTHIFIVHDCFWLLKKVIEFFRINFYDFKQIFFPCFLILFIPACYIAGRIFETMIGQVLSLIRHITSGSK